MTVKAFLQADLPIELIELLEKIVIEPSPFSDNKNLQNLLLVLIKTRLSDTSVSFKTTKLPALLKLLLSMVSEEALTIYKKYDQHALAISVSIDPGPEYATKVNEPAVC